MVVEHVPPFSMAGVRFLIAGGLLYAVVRLRGTPAPDRSEWLGGLRAGGLMLMGGSGMVCFAEQWVPSGIAALVMSGSSVWLVVWNRVLGGPTPTARQVLGLAIGLGGVAVLVGPEATPGPWWGVPVLLLASNCWCLGSLSLRSSRMLDSPAMTCALYMTCGGALLLALGAALGEPGRIVLGEVPTVAWLAFAWLVVMGSLLAGSVFTWLMRNAPVSVVSSYAFVNPVVAMLLGNLVLAEPFGSAQLIALSLGLVGMALAGRPRRERESARAAPPLRPARARMQ